MKNPEATILMENGNKIKLELFPEIAPNTVMHFISLVKEGFYCEKTFHRVGRFSHIQAGYPVENDKCSIHCKAKKDSPSNKLKLERGVISMVTYPKIDSLGTQFFITVSTPLLKNNIEATFGRVVEGMEEVDRISKVKVDENLKPIEDQRIKTIIVETYGEIYDKHENRRHG